MAQTTAADERPTQPRITLDWKVGPSNPTQYRRLLDILFGPETPTTDKPLHTQAV